MLAEITLIIGAVSLIVNTAMLGLIALQYINVGKRPKQEGSPASTTIKPNDEELRRARDKFNAEQSAFEELMNYSAEQAYGIKPKEE